MRYRFSKLYADLVTPEGEVCVAYVAWLELPGLRVPFGGLELYGRDGRREVFQAEELPREVELDPAARHIELRLQLPSGPFLLEYEVEHGAWEPSGPPPCAGLRWSVKIARARATARWPGQSSRPVLSGLGYVDWVELDRPPRLLGLESVEWGRIHLPGETVVFDILTLRSGARWRRAARWLTGGGPMELSPGEAGEQFLLEPQRILHEGPALDAQRIPGRLSRLLSVAMMGPSQEVRQVARAHLLGQPPPGPTSLGTSALYERVRFGAR